MQKMSLLIILWVLTCLVIAPAAGMGAIHVARGDSLIFSDVNPDDSTTFKVWVFGYHDDIYTGELRSDGYNFSVVIPSGIIESLDNGDYKMFVQFAGDNNMLDMNYASGKITSIYKSVPDMDVSAFSSTKKFEAFNSMRQKNPIDDVFIEYQLVVEDPSIVVENMYTNGEWALHIDAKTNLNTGNKIVAVIDEDQYGKGEFSTLMTNISVVTSNGAYNTFWLEFPHEAANQLTSGGHVITLHFLEEGVMGIPFDRHTEIVPPTPTPELRHYYDFTGDELGYWVNTTRPAPTPTVVISAKPTPVTVLAPIHINNRTISQREEIYVGERNLDVLGTLGWQDQDSAGYDFKIMYCDGDETVVTVKKPTHFDVDYETFGTRLGAWCQYSGFDEKNPPIAFIVKSPNGVNLTDPYYVPTTVPTAIIPSNQSYAVVQGEATTEIPTPTPLPTTEAIVVPVDMVVIIAAIGMAFIVARKR